MYASAPTQRNSVANSPTYRSPSITSGAASIDRCRAAAETPTPLAWAVDMNLSPPYCLSTLRSGGEAPLRCPSGDHIITEDGDCRNGRGVWFDPDRTVGSQSAPERSTAHAYASTSTVSTASVSFQNGYSNRPSTRRATIAAAAAAACDSHVRAGAGADRSREHQPDQHRERGGRRDAVGDRDPEEEVVRMGRDGRSADVGSDLAEGAGAGQRMARDRRCGARRELVAESIERREVARAERGEPGPDRGRSGERESLKGGRRRDAPRAETGAARR